MKPLTQLTIAPLTKQVPSLSHVKGSAYDPAVWALVATTISQAQAQPQNRIAYRRSQRGWTPQLISHWIRGRHQVTVVPFPYERTPSKQNPG
jgi:hypothetical protein